MMTPNTTCFYCDHYYHADPDTDKCRVTRKEVYFDTPKCEHFSAPVPLTLEQLSEMYDKPARFVDMYTAFEENVIVGAMGTTGVFYTTLEEADQFKSTKDYGQRWLAYAYPPAHIDREAWTAEWIVKGENPVQGTCSACGGKGNWRNPFCQNCGRAMTPEAWAELEKRIGGAV